MLRSDVEAVAAGGGGGWDLGESRGRGLSGLATPSTPTSMCWAQPHLGEWVGVTRGSRRAGKGAQKSQREAGLTALAAI